MLIEDYLNNSALDGTFCMGTKHGLLLTFSEYLTESD